MSVGLTEGPHAGQPREQAVPELVEAESGRLWSLARRFCGNEHMAEDLVQEVFTQAWRSWDDFEGRSSPRTWLYTIASRACGRMKRPRSGQPARIESLDELLPFGETRMAVVPDPGESPLDAAQRHEFTARVEAAIVDLPDDFRLPLVLREIAGLSLEEVGQVLDIPTATIKTRLHRARLKLRRSLEEVLPRAELPPAAYSRQVCLDLLKAKQESLDHGVSFAPSEPLVCERCSEVFASLDLVTDLCRDLAAPAGSEGLRERLRGLVGRLQA
ncbi:RNA polymerase sigma factor [Engelhardtia mirabilis]|uniref:ECF RNA polymerase sigma factor SigW n=1 Tax=Engelhardtia mirabilis TaxID=2528011 RepID=A0A518BER5_9BACT|nr:ECF RNA polymerase sigma factor SigW [Planctomycetes bacterium Pla133]QDU99804.1 ECF RNA polymerase sigma factor SigW [Planctomycetes bacterium Pla86]